jgi:nitroreductase
MIRAFTREAVSTQVVDSLIETALRAPSAGNSQGTHFIVLTGNDVEAFWNDTLPLEKRETFRWKQLLDAPVILIPCADPQAYIDRYSEPDKLSTGLGEGIDAWPTPYWTIDGSFAVMTLLLAAHDAGLGALFFAVFNGEQELRSRIGVPCDVHILGAIALGYAAPTQDVGRSAQRRRKSAEEIIHRSTW